MTYVNVGRVSGRDCTKPVVVAIAVLLALAAGHAVHAATRVKLENGLRSHAPTIIAELRKRGCRNVGVLKFRTKEGEEPISDNSGPLNLLIAQQLEVALGLANPLKADLQIQLIHDASAVAAKIPGANHLTAEGRELLFSRPYPLSWTGPAVIPDAFVTGVVEVAPDYESLRVNILIIREKEPPIEPVRRFEAIADADRLNGLSENFQLRGGAGDANEAARQVRLVRERPEDKFPLADDPAIALRFFYDGKPVEVNFDGPEPRIPEPEEGQAVTMELERIDRTGVVLAAVLKVNGENTLYRERKPNFDCAKWVFEPGSRPVPVLGFQVQGKQTAEQFRVASRAESSRLEMDYGPDVGTISLVVFRQAAKPPLPDLSDDAPDLAAIRKATFPDEPPSNPDALKTQFRSNAMGNQTRGIILDGKEIPHAVEFVKYNWEPEPIISAVIRYRRPTQTP